MLGRPSPVSGDIMRTPRINLFLLLLLLLTSGMALAEKADRDKPIDLEADSLSVNDAKKISTYTGNVILTQGTLTIRADKLIVREDKEGFQHSTSTRSEEHTSELQSQSNL